MNPRLRKLIGAVILLVFIAAYALFAMSVAQGRVTEAPDWLQSIIYCILGLIWVLPAMLIIRWMEKPRTRKV